MPVAGPVRSAVVAAAITAAATAVWGIGFERHWYAVRRHEVTVLPADSAPIRVLHISDAHLAPWQHHRKRWISALAALEPDLIVNTGDNTGHQNGLAAVQDAFAAFRGIPGIYVHGSNDHFAPTPRNPLRYFTAPSRPRASPTSIDTAEMDRFFTDDLGWAHLNNTATTVRVGDQTLSAFGVSDAHRGWDDTDAAAQSLSAIDGSQIVTVGVMHAPYQRLLDQFTDLGSDVIFAGHTHGGQVRVPGFGALVANCDIPLRQARGLSTWRHAGREVPLNVSAGIGTSIYAPVRFSCRPEASLLTLLPHQ